MKRTPMLIKKSVYFGLSIWEICKIVMYEFWYDYVKPKYADTDCFIVYIKTEDIYVNIAKDVEIRFDT